MTSLGATASGFARALSPCVVLALACAPKPKESKVARDVKIVRDENDPERLFERGRAFHAVGDLTRAEQYYAAALQAGYPEPKALPLLLRACIDGGRLQVAVDYATPVLRRNPEDHKLRLLVASLYAATGQSSVARGHLEHVVAATPDDATARYALAVLLRDELHDLVAADAHFRAYLRLAPDGAHAAEAKGSLLKDVSSIPAASAVPAASASVAPVLAPTFAAAASPSANPSTKPALLPKPAPSGMPTPVKP